MQSFFTQRVSDVWNSLPNNIVTVPSMHSFKNRLDKHFRRKPFLYDYRASIVAESMHTPEVFPGVFLSHDLNEQSIGETA